MNKNNSEKDSRYLLWPIFILAFLTIGVFITTNEVPKQQKTRSHAQVFQNPSLFPSGFADEVPTSTPTPPKPTGKVDTYKAKLSFSFSLPGIASKGGNLSPLHKIRDVELNFFDIDINSEDKTAKPLFIIKTTATFDEDTNHPTYTNFVNKEIDLQKICQEGGTCIPRGRYQIAIKQYQTLQKVSKVADSAVGGIFYDIHSGVTFSISFGNLVLGDIAPVPNGDNLVTSLDLNAFFDCFGDKLNSSDCISKQGADFDDNGVVDGYDYNLLVRSFAIIAAHGGTIPALNPTQKVEIKKHVISPSPKHVAVKVSQKSSGNILLPIVIVLLLIAGVFVALKNKKVRSLLKFKKSGFEEKEYFIKKQEDDPDGKYIWVTLADDDGLQLGRYHDKEIKEGFGTIKGVPKEENGKKFIEISEILWEKNA